jgi:hypothetical protein
MNMGWGETGIVRPNSRSEDDSCDEATSHARANLIDIPELTLNRGRDANTRDHYETAQCPLHGSTQTPLQPTDNFTKFGRNYDVTEPLAKLMGDFE